ncbi:MAG: Spy/CpxP family protein refolding chaperone [Phycisphaerae bacterium]|nr:Spy/CpxP family protein refolding chaperone [Phycisphaerae bacterium]
MTKTKLILVACFLLVFLAGGSLGMLLFRCKAKPEPRSWLADELKLTDAQREQMRKIWSEAPGPWSRASNEKRHAAATQRDGDIRELLSEPQRMRYEAIQKDFAKAMEDLSQEQRKAFDEAVAKTKQILTPEQAEKYAAIMKRQRDHGPGGPGGPGGSPRHRRPTSRPAGDRPPSSRGVPPADR